MNYFDYPSALTHDDGNDDFSMFRSLVSIQVYKSFIASSSLFLSPTSRAKFFKTFFRNDNVGMPWFLPFPASFQKS
jgi:hypothetical protein